MSTSNESYKQLAVPYFKEVFEIIDEIMVSRRYLYYLIGSNAMALELLKKGIRPIRGTKDIDFAVMLSDIKQYDEILAALESKGFNRIKDLPHRVYHPDFKVVIDILPFGQIEQDFTVKFSDRKTELHVLGFSEVMKDVQHVKVEKITVSIPPLPGMVLLKLVVWGDKPEQREHDLNDILHIIENYFDYNYDEIVEHHHDTFPDDNTFDQLKIAAQVLGRKIKQYLKQSPALEKKVKKVLNDNLQSPANSTISIEWAKLRDFTVEYAFSILESLKKGIAE